MNFSTIRFCVTGLQEMYKLYVALLFVILKISVQAGDNDQASSSSSLNILPLVMINLGQSCIKPDKIETLEKLAGSEDYSGRAKFLAQEAPDGKQVFMCPKPDPKPLEGGDNCLYSIKFDESEPLKCTHEPYPTISKFTLKTSEIHINDVYCGPKKNGRVYRLVYKICMTDEPNEKKSQLTKLFGIELHPSWKIDAVTYETEVEIYRFCYADEGSVLSTEHWISSAQLLQDERLQQERNKTYPVLFDPSNPFKVSVETMKKDFRRVDSLKKIFNRADSMKKNLDRSKSVIEEDNVTEYDIQPRPVEVSYQQEKMVPSHDFPFALWRKTTFNSFNYRRMRTDFIDLWNHIGLLIRKNAIETKKDYYIHTSVFRLTLKQPQATYPEPNVWMKKIYYFYGKPKGYHKMREVRAVAILMDAYFDTGNVEAEKMLQNRCGDNICLDAFTADFPVVGKSIRCCSLLNNADLQEDANIEVSKTLDVDFLRNKVDVKMKEEKPSEMDHDLLSEIRKRDRDDSSSYVPDAKRNKMETGEKYQ